MLSGTLGFLSAYVENPSIFDDFDENGNPVKHVNSSQPSSPDPHQNMDDGGEFSPSKLAGGSDPKGRKVSLQLN